MAVLHFEELLQGFLGIFFMGFAIESEWRWFMKTECVSVDSIIYGMHLQNNVRAMLLYT